MDLQTESSIIKEVDERATELNPLYRRFDKDFSRYVLEEFKLEGKDNQAGGTYENYTSNKPRTLIDKIVSTLASAPVHIQFTLDKDNEKSREAKNNAERFVYGNLDLADNNFTKQMLPPLQAQLSFYSALYGWYGVRAFINERDDGYGLPRVAVWHPINISWVMGAEGLAWACNKTKIPVAQAIEEWGYRGGTKKGDVLKYDLWNDEINLVIIERKFVKRPTVHKLGHIPVTIIVAGNTPLPQSLTEKEAIKHWGESSLASNRHGYDYFNRQMTYRATMVAEGVHTPIGVWSEDGKKEFDRSPYGKGRVTQFKTGEEAKPILTPSTPQDADPLLAVIDREITIGGAADILYGIEDTTSSGYKVNLLSRNASESILNTPKKAVEQGIAWIGRELLTQYSEGSFKGLKLRGEDWGNNRFNVDLKPADVKGDWYPEVTLIPRLPEDEHSRIMDSIALVEARLSSKESVMDKRLGVRDADLEMRKIRREEAREYTPIKLREMAAALVEEGGVKNLRLAQIFLDEIERQETQETAGTSLGVTSTETPQQEGVI